MTLRKWRLLGFTITLWTWRGEKRKGALGLSGCGLIIER